VGTKPIDLLDNFIVFIIFFKDDIDFIVFVFIIKLTKKYARIFLRAYFLKEEEVN